MPRWVPVVVALNLAWVQRLVRPRSGRFGAIGRSQNLAHAGTETVAKKNRREVGIKLPYVELSPALCRRQPMAAAATPCHEAQHRRY